MSCITVTHNPFGGIWCSTDTLGGIDVSAYPLGGVTASSFPMGGICVNTRSKGGISVRMWQECRTNFRAPYLEIEPEIIWVLNGWASNDVYSNVVWNVN